ncbi:PorV/PorQ family protein [candidate division KSB1 bacterium]|nr:PorV/PorQ family protein [candidate division KSB1 bacterium]
MFKKFIFIWMLMILPVSVFAGGETGLAILKIGVSARAASMGEAFVASADDASGIFWNPAGPAWIKQRQAHFTHNKWIQGISNNAAGVVFPTTIGTLGIGLMLNNVNDFERRITATEEPLGTFSSHDFSMSLNYARKIGENLSVGAKVKYLNEKIYVESASGYAFDFGVRYRLLRSGLFVAAAIQNIGSMSEMVQESIVLPKIMRFGTAYTIPDFFMGDKLLFAADYVKILENSDHVNLGIEYYPYQKIAVRAGYQTGYDERSVAAGFGLNFGFLNIDYAYIPFDNDLGNSQRFSMTAFF